MVPGHGYAQWSDKSLAKISNNPLIYNYLRLSYKFMSKNNDTAMIFAKKALHLAILEKNNPASCLGYAFLARIQLSLAGYVKALEYLQIASAINNTLKIPELEAYLRYVSAYENVMLDRTSEAINDVTQALYIYERLKDSTAMASLYKFIGNMYLQAPEPVEYYKAKLYNLKALDLLTRLKDYPRTGIVCCQLGTISIGLHQNDSAYKYLVRAVEIDNKYKNYTWLPVDYLKLGEVNVADRQYDSAGYCFRMAAKYFDSRHKMLVLIGRGKMAMQQKHYTMAQDLFSEAMKQAGMNNMTNAELDAIQGLVQTTEGKGDFKMAFQYLSTFLSRKESYSKALTQSAVSMLEIRHDFDIKTQKMQAEQEKITFESHRKNLYILFLASFSVSIILIFLLVFYNLRLRHRAVAAEKAALDQAIELKNKELTSKMMSLMKKNEMLLDIKQKLTEIEHEDLKDRSPAVIKRISREIEESTGKEIWEEFDLVFKQVHVEFYKNLINRHPYLTQGEMRLCAFLRLNLSTKEITQLTGQSNKTIEVTRTRLRKKIGLTESDTNLVAYLSGI